MWKRLLLVVAFLGVLVLAAGCSTSRPGPIPPSCATQPTATAEAWYLAQVPSSAAPGKILGTINHGPVSILSAFPFPPGGSGASQSSSGTLGRMVWSPDAHYLAVAVLEPNPVPGSLPRVVSTPYLIDTQTHTTSMITVPSQTTAWGPGRSLAWRDSHTLHKNEQESPRDSSEG